MPSFMSDEDMDMPFLFNDTKKDDFLSDRGSDVKTDTLDNYSSQIKRIDSLSSS